MTETIDVGIGDFKIVGNGHILSVTSLGSCIALILYDPVSKIGGLAHIMLPENFLFRVEESNPRRFADTGIALMLKELVAQGVGKSRLKAYVIGGANLFPAFTPEPIADIGKKNIEAVKRILARENIPLLAEDTGGDYGRNVELSTTTGEVWIKSFKHGRKKL